VGQIEGNGVEEWVAMGKGLCGCVDSVDKCGKLCRTEEMFHVERGMGREGGCSTWNVTSPFFASLRMRLNI
jgi:hypothetical protein